MKRRILSSTMCLLLLAWGCGDYGEDEGYTLDEVSALLQSIDINTNHESISTIVDPHEIIVSSSTTKASEDGIQYEPYTDNTSPIGYYKDQFSAIGIKLRDDVLMSFDEPTIVSFVSGSALEICIDGIWSNRTVTGGSVVVEALHSRSGLCLVSVDANSNYRIQSIINPILGTSLENTARNSYYSGTEMTSVPVGDPLRIGVIYHCTGQVFDVKQDVAVVLKSGNGTIVNCSIGTYCVDESINPAVVGEAFDNTIVTTFGRARVRVYGDVMFCNSPDIVKFNEATFAFTANTFNLIKNSEVVINEQEEMERFESSITTHIDELLGGNIQQYYRLRREMDLVGGLSNFMTSPTRTTWSDIFNNEEYMELVYYFENDLPYPYLASSVQMIWQAMILTVQVAPDGYSPFISEPQFFTNSRVSVIHNVFSVFTGTLNVESELQDIGSYEGNRSEYEAIDALYSQIMPVIDELTPPIDDVSIRINEIQKGYLALTMVKYAINTHKYAIGALNDSNHDPYCNDAIPPEALQMLGDLAAIIEGALGGAAAYDVLVANGRIVITNTAGAVFWQATLVGVGIYLFEKINEDLIEEAWLLFCETCIDGVDPYEFHDPGTGNQWFGDPMFRPMHRGSIFDPGECCP